MSTINLPSVTKDMSTEELANIVARLIKEVQWLADGNIDTTNAREFGGWRIDQTAIRSKDFDVGMSTDDTSSDNVRFWAGGTDPNSAPWRVYQSGEGVATGWTVQSKGGLYPRIVIDPDEDMLAAYTDATHYMRISAYDFLDGIPKLSFVSGTKKTEMYQYSGALGVGFSINSNDNIIITPGTFATTYLNGAIDVGSFSSVVGSSGSLQSALDNLQFQIDNKADWSHTHTVSIPDHNHGNPDNANSGGGTFTVF